MEKIVFEGESPFSRYRVVDKIYNGRPSRLLLSGKSSPQSGLALDENPELLFDYNQRFMEVATSLNPRKILVIGGGAFTLPSALVERFPQAEVDVVEVDPLLPRLAQEYFNLPNNPQLSVISEDGRTYIDNCQKSYDFIVVDAFNEYDIPYPLITVEAAAQYARLLRPSGTLALNLIAVYYGYPPTLAHRLLATFHESFLKTDLYPTDPYYPRREEQNYLLIASHNPSPNLDYLQSAAVSHSSFVDEQLRLTDSGNQSYA